MLMRSEDFARCRYTKVGRVVLAGFIDCQLERHIGHPSGLCEASSVDTPFSFALDSACQYEYISIGFRAYACNLSQPNSGLRVVFPVVRFCFLATSHSEVDHGTLNQKNL